MLGGVLLPKGSWVQHLTSRLMLLSRESEAFSPRNVSLLFPFYFGDWLTVYTSRHPHNYFSVLALLGRLWFYFIPFFYASFLFASLNAYITLHGGLCTYTSAHIFTLYHSSMCLVRPLSLGSSLHFYADDFDTNLVKAVGDFVILSSL